MTVSCRSLRGPFPAGPILCEDRILALVSEIHDLQSRQCEVAARGHEIEQAEALKLIDRCRARAHPGLPELEHFTRVFEQEDALRRAPEDPRVQAVTKRVQMMVWFVIFLACMGIQLDTSSLLALSGFAVLVGGMLLVTHHRLPWLRGRLRAHPHRQFVERGVPIRLSCGSDLRGQTAPRCPECGRPSVGTASEILME